MRSAFLFFVEMQFLNCQKDNSGLVVITIFELSKAQCNNTDYSNTDLFLSSDFLGRNTTRLDKQSLPFND